MTNRISGMKKLIAGLAVFMLCANGIDTAEAGIVWRNPAVSDRDKNWTTGGAENANGLQSLEFQGSAGRCSLQAERGGFEPPVHFHGHSISSAAQSATLSPLRVIAPARQLPAPSEFRLEPSIGSSD